jgi:hypothetical protein
MTPLAPTATDSRRAERALATSEDVRATLTLGSQDPVAAPEGDQPIRVGVLHVSDGLEQQGPSP